MKQLAHFLMKRKVLRETGQINSPVSASHTTCMLPGSDKEHTQPAVSNNDPSKDQEHKNEEGHFIVNGLVFI